MLNSIGNTALVRYREVVRLSEGPLSEARLYLHSMLLFFFEHTGIIAADVNTAFCCHKEASNKGMTTDVLHNVVSMITFIL